MLTMSPDTLSTIFPAVHRPWRNSCHRHYATYDLEVGEVVGNNRRTEFPSTRCKQDVVREGALCQTRRIPT